MATFKQFIVSDQPGGDTDVVLDTSTLTGPLWSNSITIITSSFTSSAQLATTTGDYILCTDSDNQIKVKSLIDNLNNLPGDNEFLLGIRSPRKDPWIRIVYSKLFKLLHNILFRSKILDPSCPFVLGKSKEFKKLPESLLLKCREVFWWAFTAVCIKFNIQIKETKIQHFERKYGNSGYNIKKIPLIATRNIIGLFLIKFLK